MLAVVDLHRPILALMPAELRAEIERDLPMLRIAAQRLGLEVLEAESQGLRYVEAIDRPTYPLMARVHHGVLDTLQWRLPPRLREALLPIVRAAARGDFDPMRKLMFALAARKDDPDAALARFLIFQAVRMNLYVWTWDRPEVEAAGCIDSVEDEAQQILEEFLASPDVQEDGVRPLHVLVSGMFFRLKTNATRFAKQIGPRMYSIVEELIYMSKATRFVRALAAPDAAVFRPGRSPEKLDSQRISDRYPWHFPSPNTVDQRRSRLRRQIEIQQRIDPDTPPTLPGDRLVDLLLSELEADEGQ